MYIHYTMTNLSFLGLFNEATHDSDSISGLTPSSGKDEIKIGKDFTTAEDDSFGDFVQDIFEDTFRETIEITDVTDGDYYDVHDDGVVHGDGVVHDDGVVHGDGSIDISNMHNVENQGVIYKWFSLIFETKLLKKQFISNVNMCKRSNTPLH